MPAPQVAKIIAVIIGPSSRAAGKLAYSKQTTKTKDTANNTVNRQVVGQREGVLQSDKKREVMSICRKKSSGFNGAKHTLNKLVLLAPLVMLTILATYVSALSCWELL